MIFNHLKFAIRFLRKEGAYSLLNLLGLTLGISVGIILLLYLQNELSYDAHHTKGNQIYRVSHHLKAEGADFNTARTARELAPLLKQDIPEVINYVRFHGYGDTMITVNPDSNEPAQYYESRIMETDSSLLSVFTHEVLEGDRKSCLTGPGKVVLTQTVAKKYYGDNPAVGQIIRLPSGDQRTVSAVISDLPDNSHLKYEILFSEIQKRGWLAESDDPVRTSEGFWNAGSYTYVLMPKDYNYAAWDDRFRIIFDKYFSAFGKKIGGTAVASLTPLKDIHFQTGLTDDEPQGNIKYVYTFATIGLLIILLACINYMNMATARSVVRTKEMGIRKVLGFTRTKLFVSILSEALLLSVLAMFLALIVDFVILEFSPFNDWINKDLSLNFLSNPTLWLGLIVIVVVVGLFSGIYPAVYIPSIPVTAAMKGSAHTNKSESWLRKSLIVLQFSVSIFVILFVVLMNRQINYLNAANVGFDRENVVLIQLRDSTVVGKMTAIRNELSSHPNIRSITSAWGTPGLEVGGQVFRVEKDGELVQQAMRTIWSGPNYLETMGIQLLDGRDFRPEDGKRESRALIINETAAQELGWKDDPINKRVRFFHGEIDMHVVGVVKDFNFESLHNKISPMFLLRMPADDGTLHVRIAGQNIDETLTYLEEQFREFDPFHPFEYQFVDKEFEKQYQADQIQMQLISALSFICIFVSILGLIGLSAFTIGQKAKEISIRKVLGASVRSILVQFSKGYVMLILVAIALAIPLANYMIQEWLAEFAYQVSVKWYFYALPGILVLLLGLVIVLLQSVKSAQANPAEGLRSE
ncbi:MAG: ABC transporter permease [Cyclobacteriaceae bacterium]